MKVIVCIKQVPDTTEVKINPETGTLMREGVPAIINPFDQYALEEGILTRERHGGTVTAISMGPPQAREALRDAVAMGVDDAVLLCDQRFAGADTLATAYTLARAIERLGGADLIICGKQAIDGDTAQVGPGVAEELDIPHISYVKKVVSIGDGRIKVERMVEGGVEVIESSMPVLITVMKDINQPRLPTLKGIMRAKRTEIKVWGLEDIGAEEGRVGLTGSPTEVIRVFTPELRKRGQVIEVPTEEAVAAVVRKLRELRAV
ncbi:MAG: electron transfer flavoprotein subunit beta/FixA family protein [Firmicutes bacterium]|jgi:electron transfer flavoprotein beta subunit|nr:electron transfer flavoprotein subunit beta/FixA family protein [Bacillota bacterium]